MKDGHEEGILKSRRSGRINMAKNIWKEAILEELDSIGIYTEEWARDPKLALHHIICWHIETAKYFAEEERWHKSFKRKLIGLWYSTPFPYWIWRMKYRNNQPPF